jgi:DNA modification methylase
MGQHQLLSVVYRPIEALAPYANNARTHSKAQIDQIAASMLEYGWTNPVLVGEDGGVIAGHGRILAAKQLGMTEVPTITLVGLTPDQLRALVIADNKLALNAGWDEKLLALELGALKDASYELEVIGFTEDELGRLLSGRICGQTDPDEVPPPPLNPATRRGDTWLLGRHRVRCGDSTEAADVQALLAGIKPHLMVTDPPYGVNYDPAWRNAAGVSSTARTGKVLNDDRADWRGAWALFPGDVAYVWHGALHATTVAEGLVAAGFEIRSQIIWAKSRFALSRGDYHWQHEPAWYVVRKGKIGHWSGDRKQTTVWHIDGKDQDVDTPHGTQKPVECMCRPIENNSSPGQAVYDPFLGSGTTVIAAEQTGRICLGMELSPAYVDVIVKRWQDFTGEAATLEGDGRTFEEISLARYDTRADMQQSYTDVIAHKRAELLAGKSDARPQA